MLDFRCACLLQVLCAGASCSVSLFMIWASSQGDRLGVTGFSTLVGSPNLGGVAVGNIFWVGSDTPLRCYKGIWSVSTMTGIGN